MPDYDYAKIGIGVGFFAMFAIFGAAAWVGRPVAGSSGSDARKWESVVVYSGQGGNEATGAILYEGPDMQQATNAAIEYVSLYPGSSMTLAGRDSRGWADRDFQVWNEDGRVYAGNGSGPGTEAYAGEPVLLAG